MEKIKQKEQRIWIWNQERKKLLSKVLLFLINLKWGLQI